MGSRTEETLELWVCPLSVAQPECDGRLGAACVLCSEAVLCVQGPVMAAPRKT